MSNTSAVVMLGKQYRRIASLHRLRTHRPKVWLPSVQDPRLSGLVAGDLAAENATLDPRVEIRRLASNAEYDTFVRQNIILVDLWPCKRPFWCADSTVPWNFWEPTIRSFLTPCMKFSTGSITKICCAKRCARRTSTWHISIPAGLPSSIWGNKWCNAPPRPWPRGHNPLEKWYPSRKIPHWCEMAGKCVICNAKPGAQGALSDHVANHGFRCCHRQGIPIRMAGWSSPNTQRPSQWHGIIH
jgi:hypothetical protein